MPVEVPVEPVFYERRRPTKPSLRSGGSARHIATPTTARTAPPAQTTPAAKPTPRWTPHVIVFAVAMFAGVVLAFTTGHHSSKNTGQAAAPVAAGTKAPPSARGEAAQPAAGARQAPAPQSPPTTTAAPPTTAAAPRTVLLDIKRDSESKTTQHFVAPGPRWTLGWAYDCTGQGGAGSFKVTVLNANGTPSPDGGVDQQGTKGSSVAAYTSTGERYLSVQTTCLWAIRVTT